MITLSFFCLFVLSFSTLPLLAQESTTSTEPLSERRVSYRMNVSLDPVARTVSGTQRLTWRNPGEVPVQELQFHLYLNAFKNENSTFFKESGGVFRGSRAGKDGDAGGVEITSMRIASDDSDLQPELPRPPSSDLTDQIEFIQPDDGNADDQTVISVPLPQPIAPGETITLDIDFESRLPEIVARTGWEMSDTGKPFFFVGQWFPKLAVYEIPGQRYISEDAPEGKWNAHQFHANSEFYADFGTYDVTISLPQSYEIGASGLQVDEVIEDGFKTVRYLADDVHDFAWTASEEFLVFEQQWKHVAIKALIRPPHKGQAQRHIDAAVVALERYDDWIGEYPYTTLTVVDGVGQSNGMEYPTLITAGTTYGLPKTARFLELVTIHEFGHQYFYGLLANNEFEEAWLDEGMNSYIESRIMDDAYGRGSAIDFGPLKLGDIEMQRLAYVKNDPSKGALFGRSWEYRMGDYSKASYNKPATVMNTLERYWGWDQQKDFLQSYYQTWRFRHPTTESIQATAEEVSGEDLDWFFDQFVYGTAVVDYAVDSITNTRNEDDSFGSRVRIHRLGDGIFPVTIQFERQDGSIETRSWAGEDKWIDFTLRGESQIVEAYIDPEFKVLLDTNRLNNRQVTHHKSDRSFARKSQLVSMTVLQKMFYLLSAIL